MWAIALSESAITTPATVKKTKNSNSHNDDNSDRIYSENDNKNNYTSGGNPEYLGDDLAGYQIVIHPDLKTLYLQSNLSTHNVFGQTPQYNVFLEYLQI